MQFDNFEGVSRGEVWMLATAPPCAKAAEMSSAVMESGNSVMARTSKRPVVKKEARNLPPRFSMGTRMAAKHHWGIAGSWTMRRK